MKFAARDGSDARTLAYTAQAGRRPRLGRSEAASHGSSVSRPYTLAPSEGTEASSRPASSSAAHFARGQQIFAQGDGRGAVYIVRSGCVRLYKMLPDGRCINLGLLGPNTLFTQEEDLDGIASGSAAEALVDSTVSVVQKDVLAAIIAGSPELAAAVVAGMSRRLTELQTLVEHLLVRDTSVRLATTLFNLAERFGRPTADGMVAITLPLTHQTLAQMIGSNRVTVTRKLLELQDGGYVRSLGRNALAVNPAMLRAFAAGGGDGAGREEAPQNRATAAA